MPDRIEKISYPFWIPDRGPYALLLLIAFTLFVLAPLLSARLISPSILEIALSLILVSGAFIVSSRIDVRLLASIVGLFSVILRLLGMSVTGKIGRNRAGRFCYCAFDERIRTQSTRGINCIDPDDCRGGGVWLGPKRGQGSGRNALGTTIPDIS